MGWMPDCRACAWHDGTLAAEWRREGHAILVADLAAWQLAMLEKARQIAWLEAMLRNLGTGLVSRETAMEMTGVAEGTLVTVTERRPWWRRLWFR